MTFYTPHNSWLGDVIPFVEDDSFYLFYLNDKRSDGRTTDKTTWNLIVTKDFLHFEEKGIALDVGFPDEADRCCYTGSVFKEDEGKYHIFYTAQNAKKSEYCHENRPIQYVVHATSNDLLTWRKHLNQRFDSGGGRYELNDWRDPFVFYNESEGKYNMLLAARKNGGGFRRAGCIATCRSDDLIEWHKGEPFYEPDMYYTHECPELFKMGDWWYLVFSTFTDKFATHYRMSRSSTGPWITPVIDTWDARGFYAAKTAFNSSGRFAFGWVPTKEGNNDFGEWQWGGTMVVHQIAQDSDGRLFPKIPDSIYRAFRRTVTPMMTSYLGKVKAGSNEIAIGGTDEISHAIFDDLSDHCMIEGRLEFSTGIRSFGVDIRMDSTLENGYFFRFEPFYNRLVFDRWPRREFAGADQSMGGERQFVVELERPLSFACLTEVRFKLILDGEVCVIYVNDTTALSTRVYNLNRNRKWSLFSQGGEIIANELAIKSF